MDLDPMSPGHYATTNQQLIAAYEHDVDSIIERWMDEASEAAISGRPERAGHIEWMVGRAFGRRAF